MNVTGLGAELVTRHAIASGIQYSNVVNENFFQAVISIVFYSSANFLDSEVVSKATMTGSVTIDATDTVTLQDIPGTGEEYGTITNGTIALGTANYTRPNASGFRRLRVDPTGITGAGAATHYKLIIKASGG